MALKISTPFKLINALTPMKNIVNELINKKDLNVQLGLIFGRIIN